MKPSIAEERHWQAPPRPEWVQKVNDEACCLNIKTVVPLDEQSLCENACSMTGLTDFGGDEWREPFRVLLAALEQEAQLHLLGRLVTRNDLLIWLQNRLLLQEAWRQQPAILQDDVAQPIFISGLPRSGTSILQELLEQDPRFRSPRYWEALFPCSTGEQQDAAITRADELVTQWQRLAPEYATMHEMRAQLPCECGLIFSHTFISDHINAIVQAPSYQNYYATADASISYRYHRKFLQTLQQGRTERWLLKAPIHLSFLPQLFSVYPNAVIIQTHRDPIKSMASAASLLGTLYWMRSDQPFEVATFEDIVLGEATAARLDHVDHQRDNGEVPAQQFYDSNYHDLMSNPLQALEKLYDFLAMSFDTQDMKRVETYLQNKPKNKFGEHRYENLNPEQIKHERPYFAKYQTRHQVVNEV